jgi:hypothetical protein
MGTDADVAELTAKYPGWDIYPVFGGWQATPAGTPVIQSVDLGGIDEKITAREAAP